MKIVVAIFLSVVFAGVGMGQEPPAPPAALVTNPTAAEIAADGIIVDRSYSNERLGLSITFPANWTSSASALANRQMLQKGQELISAGRSETFKSDVARSVSNTEILVRATGPENSPGSIAVGVERLPRKITRAQYVEATATLVRSTPTTSLVSRSKEVELGGKAWTSFEVTSIMNGQDIRQKYFISVTANTVVFVIMTGIDSSDTQAMTESVNTIRFK